MNKKHTLYKILVGLLFTYSLFAVCIHGVFVAKAENSKKDENKWPAHLRIVTGPKGGQWFQMGKPLADALSKDVLPSSSRSGGGLSNINDINNNTADMGFTLACFLGAAQSEEPAYQHIAMKNVTMMSNIYPQVFYVLVREDFAATHNIDSMEALLAQKIPLRFASLKPGTASEFMLNMLLQHGYNTSFEALKEQGWQISFSDYAEIADRFVDGDIDCFAYTAGTDVPLIRTLEEHTQPRILPLSPEVLATLSKKFKTRTYTIQPGTYKNVTKPILTLGDTTCLIIRKNIPDSLAFAMTKAVWENRKAITEVIKDFGSISPETAMTEGLPIHPGAKEFWETLKK
ncbi:TAXI family TRAP transporter solute-binding subunit [Desulfovibrio litoralis]|uniref:TRAP transporter solute receptor, TAXI family n=1 Tax=Desulfovibrio litoralis DSM 11393 TaxID=1121455 RepID=A0A1M7TJ37_9BACT|nr:TAXI family TRAP transporter solute-binding subunit [Desulfovibrio litoralis]SHN70772.1 hypothetical protein SAMN02745728_02098 [Desulfovibrio litoralis DSM 11393]